MSIDKNSTVFTQDEAVELACYDLFDVIKLVDIAYWELSELFITIIALSSIATAIKVILSVHVQHSLVTSPNFYAVAFF